MEFLLFKEFTDRLILVTTWPQQVRLHFLPSVAFGLVFSSDLSTGDTLPPPHSRPLKISGRAAVSPIDKPGKDSALSPMTPENPASPGQYFNETFNN